MLLTYIQSVQPDEEYVSNDEDEEGRACQISELTKMIIKDEDVKKKLNYVYYSLHKYLQEMGFCCGIRRQIQSSIILQYWGMITLKSPQKQIQQKYLKNSWVTT